MLTQKPNYIMSRVYNSGADKLLQFGLCMDQQKGWLINLFDFCQPFIDVHSGQLTNENARFL